jgi:hypothetical protein
MSPAAQAVAWAYNNTPTKPTGSYYWLAAALRAAADHIDHDWSGFNCVDALCEIAAELEDFSD